MALFTKHILFCEDNNLEHIRKNFCGKVICDIKKLNNFLVHNNDSDIIIYLGGNIAEIINLCIFKSNPVYIVKELSYNYEHINSNIDIISIGELPINIHNVGIYFRNFFEDNDYFNLINNEHQFQFLTQSNKVGVSFRKGIYLSNVTEHENELHFNLLRCSTNLSGPTDNFRNTDKYIINKVNNMAKKFFESPSDLNHVLAQIYENKVSGNKEKKAGISLHSDKTKDMPNNGIMAFCTFYTNFNDKTKQHEFDYHYNGESVLTKLNFKIKNPEKHPLLPVSFSITLYPNSVFIMPLSTNRIYQHEIKGSILPVDKIPTRMGYVIRCSNKLAIYKNENVYIKNSLGQLVKLNEITKEEREQLRKLYYEENTTENFVEYGNFYSSMNNGDYMKPLL